MKTVLAYIWQRRWCRLMLVGLMVCALPLLHPFVRQSIFGPTIDGIPWYAWENQVRHRVDPQADSWPHKMLLRVGLIEEHALGNPPVSAEALPFWLHLANSREAPVRRVALEQLGNMKDEFDPQIEPVYQEHLHDPDPRCRLAAAFGIWRKSKAPMAKEVTVALANNSDHELRWRATCILAELARDDPQLFGLMATLTEDSHAQVRCAALVSMQYFGKRGLPVLQRGLRDADTMVQRTALQMVPALGKDAEPLIPTVLALHNDPMLRSDVAIALRRIDAKRSAQPVD